MDLKRQKYEAGYYSYYDAEQTHLKRKIAVLDQEVAQPTVVRMAAPSVPAVNITIPSPEMTLNSSIYYSQTAEQLYTAIMCDNKETYNKHEIMFILSKLTKIINPTFSEPCEYIA